jgi:hypothetical protein
LEEWMAKSILSLIILLGVLFVSLIAYRTFAQESLISTITSPDKTYALRLTGQKSRPKVPLIAHTVYFDLFRNNEPVELKKVLHSGFWFDASFDTSYPRHSWVSNSIIMFYQKISKENERDTLILSNNTDKWIRYVRVQSVDLFLIFDVKPKSQTKLTAYPQTWLSWLTVEGEFVDGNIISKNGTNFSIDPKLKGPFQYNISINDAGPEIESPQLKKYEP